MNTYIAGNIVPLHIPCLLNGQPIVPTDVYLTIKVSGHPAMRWHWPETPGPITEMGTGTFLAMIDSTTYPVQWVCDGSWKGAGTQAIGTVVLNVSPTPVPPPFGS